MKNAHTCITKTLAIHFLLVCALLAGCATTELKPLPKEAVTLDKAVAHATDDIFAQAQQRSGFFGRMGTKTFVIDPLLDGASGQQTVVMQAIEEQIGERVRGTHTQWE